jgi:hypothetical protein
MSEKVIRIDAEVGQFYGVTRNYTGKENDVSRVIVDNAASSIEVTLKSQQYASKYEFPNSGNEGVLYTDIVENKTYRWDSGQLKYYCVGSNYEDIKIINGGNANNE